MWVRLPERGFRKSKRAIEQGYQRLEVPLQTTFLEKHKKYPYKIHFCTSGCLKCKVSSCKRHSAHGPISGLYLKKGEPVRVEFGGIPIFLFDKSGEIVIFESNEQLAALGWENPYALGLCRKCKNADNKKTRNFLRTKEKAHKILNELIQKQSRASVVKVSKIPESDILLPEFVEEISKSPLYAEEFSPNPPTRASRPRRRRPRKKKKKPKSFYLEDDLDGEEIQLPLFSDESDSDEPDEIMNIDDQDDLVGYDQVFQRKRKVSDRFTYVKPKPPPRDQGPGMSLVDHRQLYYLVKGLIDSAPNLKLIKMTFKRGDIYFQILKRDSMEIMEWRSSESVGYGQSKNVQKMSIGFSMKNMAVDSVYEAFKCAGLYFVSRPQMHRNERDINESFVEFYEQNLDLAFEVIEQKLKRGVTVKCLSFDGQWSTPQKRGRRANHNVVTFILYLSDGSKYVIHQELASRFQIKDDDDNIQLKDMFTGEDILDLEKWNVQMGLLKLFQRDIIAPILVTDGCKSAEKSIRAIYCRLVQAKNGTVVYINRDYFHVVPKLKGWIRKEFTTNGKKSGSLKEEFQVAVGHGMIETIQDYFLKCILDNEDIVDIPTRISVIRADFSNCLVGHVEEELGGVTEITPEMVDHLQNTFIPNFSSHYFTFFDTKLRTTDVESYHSKNRRKGENKSPLSYQKKVNLTAMQHALQFKFQALKKRVQKRKTKYGTKTSNVLTKEQRITMIDEWINKPFSKMFFNRVRRGKKKKRKAIIKRIPDHSLDEDGSSIIDKEEEKVKKSAKLGKRKREQKAGTRKRHCVEVEEDPEVSDDDDDFDEIDVTDDEEASEIDDAEIDVIEIDDDEIDESDETIFDPLEEIDLDEVPEVEEESFTTRQEVVADKFNIKLTRDKMKCLESKQWLNDEIVNFYLQLILEKVDADNAGNASQMIDEGEEPMEYHFLSSFFYFKLAIHKGKYDFQNVVRWLKEVKIIEKDVIMIPVNIGNYHWLLAEISLLDKKVRIKNSLAGDQWNAKNLEVGGNLKHFINDMLVAQGESSNPGDWTVEISNVPSQRNGYDCGVFTLFFALCECLEEDDSFSETASDTLRARIHSEIINMKIL